MKRFTDATATAAAWLFIGFLAGQCVTIRHVSDPPAPSQPSAAAVVAAGSVVPLLEARVVAHEIIAADREVKPAEAAPAVGMGRMSYHATAVKSFPWIVELKSTWQGTYQPHEATAAGVVVDPHGYAVTCQHLVHSGGKMVMVHDDDSEAPVEVVAEDAVSDLALVKLPAGAYSAATFAGETPLVGDQVITVGHPQGFRNSVSTGVVSGLNRTIHLAAGATLRHMIQTSAGIQPGCSGGPLLNLDGEVVGLNDSGCLDAPGVGFAVSGEPVKAFVANNLRGK